MRKCDKCGMGDTEENPVFDYRIGTKWAGLCRDCLHLYTAWVTGRREIDRVKLDSDSENWVKEETQ